MENSIKVIQRLSIVLILLVAIMANSYAKNVIMNDSYKPTTDITKDSIKYKITFVELGSVRCIPCQQMQIVMKSISEKYVNVVNVVFYDVWTPEGKPYSQKYGIKAIPTQVLLDENGKEFFRHEGYFPEEELVKDLQKKLLSK